MKRIVQVFLVKSVNENNTGDDGKTNLKLFTNNDEAQAFKREVSKQIPRGSDTEWVSIEDFFLELDIDVEVTV
jgi:hypothetical protein